MDIALVEFLAKSLHLLVLLLHLLGEVVDDLLELTTLHTTLANLLLQLVDKFLVLLHDTLDELEVLLDTLSGVGTFALLGKGDTVLGLGNLTETFLDVAQRSHHVIDLIVFLSNDLVQRVTLLLSKLLGFLHSVIATSECDNAHG